MTILSFFKGFPSSYDITDCSVLHVGLLTLISYNIPVMEKDALVKKVTHKLKHNFERFTRVARWIVFSFVTGLLLGVIGAAFARAIEFVTAIRLSEPRLLLLLPVGAVMIVFLYHVFRDDSDGGTDSVLAAIHTDSGIPLRMAPLIFISTTFSHLCGASVGREGAALQMGGSIGNSLGKLFHFEQNDKNTMIMCGMSGVFSAMFGTPIAAAIFSLEVVSVGIMHYAALVPCVISSFVARRVALYLGVGAPFFAIEAIPAFELKSALFTVLLAVLCGLLSILFCMLLHKGGRLARKKIENPYIRGFIFGSLLLIMTFFTQGQAYNGTGIAMIESSMAGELHPAAFIIKILFTVVSLIAGYRGGEIIPSFFIGASFGATMGHVLNFAPSLCAAVGMGAVFCGVTNCPVTAFLICLELFGFEGAPYFLLAIAISYTMSGYYGLYQSQTIVYSKYKSNYINKRTK